MTAPLQVMRQIRDQQIVSLEVAARNLLLSNDATQIVKAVRGLEVMLDVAETLIEGLSTSSRGYARRDMDEDVIESLDNAKRTLTKLRALYYSTDGTHPA